MTDLLNIGLALLILGLAAWTIFSRELFAAAAGFIAYGLLLTLVWVQLHGIDVALTEAAIGGGLTGVLLMGAAGRLLASAVALNLEAPSLQLHWLAGLVSAAVSIALTAVNMFGGFAVTRRMLDMFRK